MPNEAFIILLIGGLLAISLAIKNLFHTIKLSPVIGFILLGWVLRSGNTHFDFLTKDFEKVLFFFGDIGIILILFRVGVESHIQSLISQLKRASFIAVINILLSGILGFVLCYYLFNFHLVESCFVGIALTATSIGISLQMWKDKKLLRTKEGGLLLDLAALDDIVAIALMALLFDLAPILHQGRNHEILEVLIKSSGIFFVKIIIFSFLCYLFSHFFEKKFIGLLDRFEKKPDPMITAVCISLIIASIAAFLGFSIALGAFFAGLAFSKDPRKIKMETSFVPLENFFGPFFFITVGFRVLTGVLEASLLFTLSVLLVAFFTKFAGTYIPAYMSGLRSKAAVVLGLSMIPRAEVAMVVMEQGLELGPWAISEVVYSAMVVTVLLLAFIAPLSLRPLLRKSVVTHMQRL